ncbi:2,4'-dihydroxyacetophenone dioxygenase family protein [Paraburkholderia sp. BL10I2N1]|uniref:2,4'-dihydroxyacetophenone dioxygenase family protein n=1 Tax=Paraburkholderia sp. BL10I2N1 TaxID=1938796 RepID=UPI001060F877|nr:2,4'-dihydroxyacetophenone dioxygenase family protein [Paraburkholderia sp. BL10I2N1]TDN64031.1 ChrR-like protein with cupin domain [Paraburkholderia sp. BL10I2N1]
MFYEKVATECIDDASIPWVPFAPYSTDVLVKYFKLDPTRGETITLLKAPAGVQMPKHHHTGTVIVYTIKGRWKYAEHDWVAGPGSIVFETAGSSHTPLALPGDDEIIALNIVQGDLLYLNDNDQVIAKENWKTGMERYLAYCEANRLIPKDLTAFGG